MKAMRKIDFNDLEKIAASFAKDGRYADALKIFFYMADGDQSLDGGSLGSAIGVCYEKLGDLHAAKYWYGRALEENPGIKEYQEDRQRLEAVDIAEVINEAG